jgi:hypothetical protein
MPYIQYFCRNTEFTEENRDKNTMQIRTKLMPLAARRMTPGLMYVIYGMIMYHIWAKKAIL